MIREVLRKKILLITAVFAVIIVGLVALVWQSYRLSLVREQHKEELAEFQTKLRLAETTGSSDGYFHIKEAGYKFKVPEGLSDLVYFYHPGNHSTYFSSRSLMDLAFIDGSTEETPELWLCAPGDLALGAIQFGLSEVEAETIVLSQRIENVYFRYHIPKKTGCSKSERVLELQAAQRKLIQQAFRSIETEGLKFKAPSAPANNFGSPF